MCTKIVMPLVLCKIVLNLPFLTTAFYLKRVKIVQYPELSWHLKLFTAKQSSQYHVKKSFGKELVIIYLEKIQDIYSQFQLKNSVATRPSINVLAGQQGHN